MSAVAVAFRSRVQRVHVGVSADAVALATVATLTFVLAALTWGTWGDLSSDTGYDLVAGARVADGDIPYRDFVYYYGPLAPFLAGLAALIGGAGLTAGIALGFVLTVLILGATYVLARQLLDPLGSGLATALTAGVAFIPDNYGYVLPHTFAATLGTLGLLALLLCVERYASTAQAGALVAAGFVAGTLTLTKPEPALAGFAAVAAWLALRALAGASLRRELMLFGLPALAVPVTAYGALATVVSARDILLENLYPVDVLRAGGDRLVEVRMPLTVQSIVELGGKLVFYAIGVAALLLAARAIASARWRRGAIAACVTAAALVVVASVTNPDALRERMYDVWGWIPAGALIAVFLVYRRYSRRTGGWSARAQLELAAVVALAVVAFTTYGAFVFNGWRPQMAVYYAPLAAIFVTRLHLVDLVRSRPARILGVAWVGFLAAAVVGLTLHRAHQESATVRGVGGELTAEPGDARVYQGAVDAIERHTAPGEPILAAPLLTSLHIFTDRPSPLPIISTLPPALPSTADELAAIKRLDDVGVRLAVIDTRDWIGYGHSSFGDSFDRSLGHWLESKFDRIAVLRGSGDTPRVLEIWKRRGT